MNKPILEDIFNTAFYGEDGELADGWTEPEDKPSDKRSKFKSTWTSFTGPKGGRGWRNDKGDVLYQDDKPSDSDGKVGSTGKSKASEKEKQAVIAKIDQLPGKTPQEKQRLKELAGKLSPEQAKQLTSQQGKDVPDAHQGEPGANTTEGQSTHVSGDTRGIIAAAKVKLNQVKELGKAIGKAIGEAIWSRTPAPAQKVLTAAYSMGKAVEHKLEGYYKAGKELAKEVARERGGDDKHVERVGRILGIADGIARWSVNIPIVHHGLGHGAEAVAGVLGHAAEAALHTIGGVAYIGNPATFLAAKIGFYIPVASLGYVAYSMGAATVTGRNPFTMIKNARERVRNKLKKSETHHG